MPWNRDVALSAELDRLTIVLVSPRNPLNIGAAARAMSNFGISRLRVVNPYELAFREARSAVGASSVLHRAAEFTSLAEAVADCTLVIGTTAGRKRELHHPLRSLADGTRLIRSRLKSGRVALLFGSEKRGLSNEDFSHCHWLMRIPTREERGSMNLGQAVAVCLYEIERTAFPTQAKIGPECGTPYPGKPLQKFQAATAGEAETITQRLLEALTLSGYVKPRAAASTEEKIRRMVRRLSIPASDADAWMGIPAANSVETTPQFYLSSLSNRLENSSMGVDPDLRKLTAFCRAPGALANHRRAPLAAIYCVSQGGKILPGRQSHAEQDAACRGAHMVASQLWGRERKR